MTSYCIGILQNRQLEGAAAPSSSVDNIASVMNYPYHSAESNLRRKNKLLRELDFSFNEEINIPGMPMTKEDDFLNQYIFSESQAPQGICFTDDYCMISSYSEEAEVMGELMILDRESGRHLVTLGMDENSHLGGITFDGTNVWVCNSHEHSIERISYNFIQLMAVQNEGQVVDARSVVDIYPVRNIPSCITYYSGRLWIATHRIMMRSKMIAYHYNNLDNQLTVLSDYTIPSKVQGVTFDDDGNIYLSTSYGRNSSSYLKCYSSVIDLSAHPNRPKVTVEMPPCSEEIDICEDTLYVLFESAGERYYEGTDGKGQSRYPIDQLLMLPVDELVQ